MATFMEAVSVWNEWLHRKNVSFRNFDDHSHICGGDVCFWKGEKKVQEKNRTIYFVKRPEGMVTENCFSLKHDSIPEPQDGEVLLETLYLSVDPYMRGRMRNVKSYVAPFRLHEPMSGGGIARVIQTRNEHFHKGDIVLGHLPWRDYSTAAGKHLRKINPEFAPVTTALGVLGMPGMTAYFGLLDIGAPKKGETVFISGAAGAVGSVAGQIAKIKGLRVIGSAGSDEKVRYLKEELHFDEAFNYKKVSNFASALKTTCPDGIDIYFDNVGGEISDAAIKLINHGARIVVCGQISLYNQEKIDFGPRVGPQLITKSALMKGFTVGDYKDRRQEALQALARWYQEGKLTYRESVVNGLENAPQALISLFYGKNFGKQLVKVANFALNKQVCYDYKKE